MKLKIIYYVHGTLSNKNVDLSVHYLGIALRYVRDHRSPGEGWTGEFYEKPEVVLVDSGFDGGYTTEVIKERLEQTLDFQHDIKIMIPPKTTSVAQDIQWQINNVRDADWYLCMKADFVLHNRFIQYLYEYAHAHEHDPYFQNCAKFDLREHVDYITIDTLTRINEWNLVANLPQGCSHYNIADWGDNKHYVGYDGIDGCFHFYSEEARQLLRVPHFINQETWNMNIKRGVLMCHGNWKFFGYHVWHDIPRPDPKKGKIGHRF